MRINVMFYLIIEDWDCAGFMFKIPIEKKTLHVLHKDSHKGAEQITNITVTQRIFKFHLPPNR